MIKVSQMHATTGAADEIADVADLLRKIEERLFQVGLVKDAAALRQARSAVAGVGLNLSNEARATYAALRAGKDVPK